MRYAIYTHCAAVAICVAFSLCDRGFLRNDVACYPLLVLFPLALLAWIVCPLIALVQLWRGTWTDSQKTAIVLAEGLLTVAQFYAIAPAVS